MTHTQTDGRTVFNILYRTGDGGGRREGDAEGGVEGDILGFIAVVF